MNTQCKFKELSVFVECSTGSTPTVKSLKKYIDLLEAFGYSQLYLGLTDGYKIEGEPYFNLCRGGYTTKQLKEIDAYAEAHGIELRANIQVLAHLPYVCRHDCYRELFDTERTLYVGKDEVYKLIDKMFATISAGIKSRIIHIGMDEAFDLGLGQYLNQNGYVDRTTLFLQHLERVLEIAKRYGYFCEIWSDTFFHLLEGSERNGGNADDVRARIPKGVRLIRWKYGKEPRDVFSKALSQHKAICDDVGFAGAAWTFIGNAPDNRYGIDTIEQQMEICLERGIENYMITMWTDAHAICSIYAVLPTLFVAGEIAKGKKSCEIDKLRFKKIVGVDFDDFMLLDNLNNPFFKDLKMLNSRCFWGLWSDVFLGSYDLYLDGHTGEAYKKLAERLGEVDAGDYQLMFREYEVYAKVLSVKMNLGVQTRKAYREGNKALLKHYALEVIPQMISDMNQFILAFEQRWMNENQAFGLEVNHLFYGGVVERWRYIARQLLQHIETGEPIDEMEREEMLPSLIPQVTEDDCLEVNYRKLISYCGI